MTFKIEKGVPVPPKPGTRETIYPFAEMAPGDSFAVPVPDGRTALYAGQLIRSRAAAWAGRHAPGAKFVTRTEGGGKSVRIWLLSKSMPLAPTAAIATPPPVAAGRVHRLADDDTPPASTTKPAFAHPVGTFGAGGKPVRRDPDAEMRAAAKSGGRVVKGSRY